jgi:hypothetical protein
MYWNRFGDRTRWVLVRSVCGAVTGLILAGGCSGDDESQTPSTNPWAFYRSLEAGDCYTAPPALPAQVDCDDDEVYAFVYAVLEGSSAAGPCPPPDGQVPPSRLSGFNVPEGDPLLLCLVLEEQAGED